MRIVLEVEGAEIIISAREAEPASSQDGKTESFPDVLGQDQASGAQDAGPAPAEPAASESPIVPRASSGSSPVPSMAEEIRREPSLEAAGMSADMDAGAAPEAGAPGAVAAFGQEMAGSGLGAGRDQDAGAAPEGDHGPVGNMETGGNQ